MQKAQILQWEKKTLLVYVDDDERNEAKKKEGAQSKIKFNKLCRGLYALAAYALNLLRHSSETVAWKNHPSALVLTPHYNLQSPRSLRRFSSLQCISQRR